MNEKYGEPKESIELSLPVNPAYVSAARLTASTIANRMMFDVDEIEDVKAAVSEACAYIIARAVATVHPVLTIVFRIYGDMLGITLTFEGERCDSGVEDMSLIMISGLVDEADVDTTEEAIRLSMLKKHVGVSFGV